MMNFQTALATIRTRITFTQLALIGLIGAAAFLFLGLSRDIWLNEVFAWDPAFMLWLRQLHAPWLTTFFLIITQLASMWILVPLIGVVVGLWRVGERKTAVFLLASYAGSGLLVTLFKLLFARPRPTVFTPVLLESSFSFPSGHAVGAMAVYGLAALILWQRKRFGWAVVAGLLVPVISLSRIYLGVHYPSDVLASLAAGTMWLVLVMFFYNRTYVWAGR